MSGTPEYRCPRPKNITRLLFEREIGKKPPIREISARSGWNINRMEDMILVVGATTPAAACYPSDSESDQGSIMDEDELFAQQDSSDDEESDHESLLSQNESGEEIGSIEMDGPDDNRQRQHHRPTLRSTSEWRPSIKHKGCINTACWLEAPWRLFTSGTNPIVQSFESPTQIMTSGDDRMLKIWDLSHAMGMASPIPGGWDTFCPFADNNDIVDNTTDFFRRYYRNRNECKIAGQVKELVSINTGHRSNVFHVCPIKQKPGKVLSCAADGYLRLIDLERETSTVVLHPSIDDADSFHGGGMAFSHVSLGPNTGLLCSEMGLHRFDLRMNVREQLRKSLLEQDYSERDDPKCKACAIWSPCGQVEDSESYYVFAGGAYADFALYDLRMDGSSGQAVSRYCPRYNQGHIRDVGISGLEVSKDGREVLVSYESDQIYTFPVFPSGNPTLDDIEGLKIRQKEADKRRAEDHDTSCDSWENASALFSGHLNRFTFLKCARFGGPNDEYICTGSDSGHAWIYDKSTGAVVTLLSADPATCNGITPHPTLPYFVTYGISSSAKVWRSSKPVDTRVDDSSTGRSKAYKKTKYEISPVANDWNIAEKMVNRYISPFTSINEYLTPDTVIDRKEFHSCGHFATASGKTKILPIDGAPDVGNALCTLPTVLRQNCFQVYRGESTKSDYTLAMPIGTFKERVSLSRLRHQARSLGGQWEGLDRPWHSGAKDADAVDGVPNYPSDWLTFDPRVGLVSAIEANFPTRRRRCPQDSIEWLADYKEYSEATSQLVAAQLAYRKTILMCKEAGNEALKRGNFELAGRRYDKAIQYLSILFLMDRGDDSPWPHLTRGHTLPVNNDHSRREITSWSEDLKLLITCHMNLSLLFLKDEMSDPLQAKRQADRALALLARFLEESSIEKESSEIHALAGKAYFRRGSALLELGKYTESLEAFQSAVEYMGNDKVDPLLAKRMHKAKRKMKEQRTNGSKLRKALNDIR